MPLLAISLLIAFGQPAEAPSGFTQMCARDSQLCALHQAQTNGAPLPVVTAINTDVNRHTVGMSDRESHGVDDFWSRPNGTGDCEDFAIEKRIRLEQAGVNPDSLFYAVAFVRGMGLHTVLIYRQDGQDYVLDNLSARIEKWQNVHYSWVRYQLPGNPQSWVYPDRSLK